MVTKAKSKVILIFKEKRQARTKEYVNDLKRKNRGNLSLITNANKSNEYEFLKSIRENIQKNTHKVKATPLVEVTSFASEYGIQLDDDQSSLTLTNNVDTWLKLGTKRSQRSSKITNARAEDCRFRT